MLKYHVCLRPTFAITGVQKQNEAALLHVRVDGLVYARHGRELMGCKSPVYESCYYREDRNANWGQVLHYNISFFWQFTA